MIFSDKEKKVRDLETKVKKAIKGIREELVRDGISPERRAKLENRLDKLTSLARTEAEECKKAKS